MATNNILDLPRDQFLASLNELAAQGVNTDELMRQYRRANSPFSGFFDWAINSERDIANEGRTTAGAGLFSKEAGTTGMDALASTRIEPANFIAGLLSGGAQAVDAAGATLKGLVPAADMPMEALGTAGMAMTGGAAAPKPRGALGANSLRVYHGTDANIDRLDPAYGRTARDLYTTPIRDDAAMYGRNVLEFDVSGNIGDFRPDARTRETTQLMRKVYSEHGLSDYFDSFDEFVDAFDSGDLYQRFGNSRAQDDIVAGLLDEGGFDAVRIPDAGFGGSMSESVVARSPDVFAPVSNPAEPVAQAVENVQPSEGGFFNFPIDELSANRDATTGAIASAASGGFDEYLRRVNPQGYRVDANDRPNLMMGDMYGMLPRDARKVGEHNGVSFYQAPDGASYATAFNPDVGEMDVVGYAMPRGDMTDLAVVNEMQGRGIGSELQYLMRSQDPYAPTGGLTEAGEASLRRTYNRLRDQGIVSANASPLAGILAMPNEEERNRQLGMLFGGYR